MTPTGPGGQGVPSVPQSLGRCEAPLCCLAALLRRHPAVGHPEHVPAAGRGAPLPLLSQEAVVCGAVLGEGRPRRCRLSRERTPSRLGIHGCRCVPARAHGDLLREGPGDVLPTPGAGQVRTQETWKVRVASTLGSSAQPVLVDTQGIACPQIKSSSCGVSTCCPWGVFARAALGPPAFLVPEG